MPFPLTCQSPVTCDGAPIGRKGDTWLCMACLGYTDKHKHFPEFSMSTVRKQIIAHVQQHGATHTTDLARAINASVTSVSTVATTLRREGVLMPAKGDGVIRLTPAPAESALPDAVPGYPLLWQSPDRQGGAVCVRGTRVDVVTLWMTGPAYSGALSYGVTLEQAQAAIDYVDAHPELQPPAPEDTVQTSEADVLRAEVTRLTEELATSNMAFDGQSKAMALVIAERDTLREQNALIVYLKSELEASVKEAAALGQILSDCATTLGAPDGVPLDALPGIALNLRDERDALKAQLEKDGDKIMQMKNSAAVEVTTRGTTAPHLYKRWEVIQDALTTIVTAAGITPLPLIAADIPKWANDAAVKIAHNAAFVAAMQNAGPAVRLEWSPWEDDYAQLFARFGRLNRQIASIRNGDKAYATIDVSDVREDGDVAINISGVDMKQVTDLLRESLMALAGLTMPPVPALPEPA